MYITKKKKKKENSDKSLIWTELTNGHFPQKILQLTSFKLVNFSFSSASNPDTSSPFLFADEILKRCGVIYRRQDWFLSFFLQTNRKTFSIHMQLAPKIYMMMFFVTNLGKVLQQHFLLGLPKRSCWKQLLLGIHFIQELGGDDRLIHHFTSRCFYCRNKTFRVLLKEPVRFLFQMDVDGFKPTEKINTPKNTFK